MRRTNIYLSDEQDRALRDRAATEGSTKSAVLREILDESLGSAPTDPEIARGFAELADRWDELTEGLFDDDPDLRIDR